MVIQQYYFMYYYLTTLLAVVHMHNILTLTWLGVWLGYPVSITMYSLLSCCELMLQIKGLICVYNLLICQSRCKNRKTKRY